MCNKWADVTLWIFADSGPCWHLIKVRMLRSIHDGGHALLESKKRLYPCQRARARNQGSLRARRS